jgi:two-component SAPR family response regulator
MKKFDPLILIVDSETDRSVPIAQTLLRNGFLTMSMQSASDALDACRNPTFKVDLVLSRIVLGAMSGFDLGETIEEEQLPVKFLLISHHDKDLLGAIPRFTRFRDRFVQNPVSDEEILVRIRRELGITTNSKVL